MIRKIALWMRDVFIRNRSLNATRVVAGSFAAIILVGALLLTLPIASRDGRAPAFLPDCSPPPLPPASPD